MNLKYLPPEEKKMYMVVVLGIGAMGSGMIAEALPALGIILFPVAVICAVGFVAAFVGPSEKLFPLRTLPRRMSPALWAWLVYLLKVILFFAGISIAIYFLARAVGNFTTRGPL